MKIFLGPAGIPLRTDRRETIEGIKTVHSLGLNAMEIEFVRGVYMKKEMAEEVGKVAQDLGVRLSVHAPYFINLASEKKETIIASRKRIFDSAQIGEIVGADAIAIHSAYYGKLGPEKTFEIVKEQFLKILDDMKNAGIKNVKLGIETMAKKGQFGTLDEVLRMHKEVKQVFPYIDWAHVFVRNGGKINYAEVFDKLERAGIKHINSHFEGVAKNKAGEYVDVHEPMKNPPFEPLAEEILRRKVDITLISESPVLEEDSLRMRSALEGLGRRF
jgi:deoxyribonuclease-4